MSRQGIGHRMILLTTGFRYPNRRLLFARARLYFDRIELSGWSLGQRQRAEIKLSDVAEIRWQEAPPTAPNVVFHLHDGTEIAARLDEPAQWRDTLEHRLSWRRPHRETTAPGVKLDLPLRDLIAYTTSMS